MRKGPDYIQFYPTLRCNRSCEFCFNKNMPAMPDMPPAKCGMMFNTLKDIGVRAIDIIGGEPTLHAGLAELTSRAVKLGLRVNISSNGSAPELLADLASLGGSVRIGLSVNDRETLEALTPFILAHRPVVKSVLTRRFDRSFAAEILSLMPAKFYLIYRDAFSREDLAETIPFDRYLAVWEDLEPYGVGAVFCSGFLPDTADSPELSTVRCPAGTTKLGILPDGSVYPCNLFFGRQEFLLGNILTDPFERIWHHPALEPFRSFRKNACPNKACRLHGRCHGGCPAHSILYGDGPADADPRCMNGS